MAHFRGVVRGSRGAASRLGTARSGIWAEVDGWEVGAIVVMVHEDGVDKVQVYRTDGSRRAVGPVLVAEWEEGEAATSTTKPTKDPASTIDP